MDSVTFTIAIRRAPLSYLSDELKDKRLIEGLVVGIAFIERFGSEKLMEYYNQKGVPTKPLKIETFGVKTIVEQLCGFGLIDNGTHSKVTEAIRTRNKVVHDLDSPDKLDEAKLKVAIQQVIDCLMALGVKE